VSPRRPSSLSWSTEPEAARRRGRPADPERDALIEAAVVEVLAHDGYGGLTMDAVAATAGVSKATIYRRWPTKADLLVSVIDSASDVSLVGPDTGSLQDDLVALLTALSRVLTGPGGSASRALLGALNDDPAMAAAFRQGPMERWRQAFTSVFERAVARGEVSPTSGTSLAAEAGPAIFLMRWTISGRDIDEDLAGRVVHDVMMPLLGNLES
jgi:AcrR family transcriptional regulator